MALTKTGVSALYVTIFNRASEGNGNTYWQTQGDLAEVANKMLATPDAQAYFGDSLNDDKAFVEWIYKNTFNKTYADDPAGIDHWVQDLAHGATRGDVVANLVTAALDPANAGPAQDQFINRITVSNYVADHVPEAPADYKTALGFDGNLHVTNIGQTVADAEAYIDQTFTAGQTFDLTPEVDNIIGTDKSDTINATSATLGTDDIITDPSSTDSDTMNIALTGDMPAFTAINVENMNVDLKTLGGTTVDADNIIGSTITVSSNTFGFSGQATVANLDKNDVVAGDNITDLTVKGITKGTIDTGSATNITAETVATTDSISLKVHGDVTLDASAYNGGTAADYKNLTIEADKAAVVDVSGSAHSFTGKGDVSGSGDVTLKTAAGDISGKEVTNSGDGSLTIELTDNADADLKKVATDKVITDVTYSETISYKEGALDITAKAAGNATMQIEADAQSGAGGSTPNTVTVHLEKKATTDELDTTNVTDLTVDAQKGGTITSINTTNKDANVTLITKENDLTVTNLDAQNKSVIIDGSSTNDVTLTAVQASVVNASTFTKDFSATQSDDEDIAVLGGSGKNTITTAATDKTVSIVTQDSDDIINAATVTTGKLTVTTAGGKDTVTATALDGKANIDLGAGDDTIDHIKGGANADITVAAADGKDSMTIDASSDGKLAADMGAGDDTVDMNAGVAASADVSLTMGTGDDLIKATGAGAETLTFDGGAGTDTVEVKNGADFSAASLTLTEIENLKIDTVATFADNQLNDQTMNVSSGTAAVDVLHVNLDASLATDSANTTNLSTLNFSASSATEVEYVDIDASTSLSDDTIKGAHNATNVIDLGAGAGKETVQLYADAIGTTIDNLQDGAPQADVTAAMLQDPEANVANTSFDVAVITHFETADDSLVLGDAATATNYTEKAIDFDSTTGPDTAGIEDYLAAAVIAANNEIANAPAGSDIQYVYIYDDAANGPDADAWLMWDSDNNDSVDAAILLAGVESANDGSGFAASDIVAAS